MEFVLAQELKKPREDMELRDSRVSAGLYYISCTIMYFTIFCVI